jgi:hypothetical protein
MFGFGKELTNHPSEEQQETWHYNLLGIRYLEKPHQEEYFKYNNNKEYTNPRFQELVQIATKNQSKEQTTLSAKPQFQKVTVQPCPQTLIINYQLRALATEKQLPNLPIKQNPRLDKSSGNNTDSKRYILPKSSYKKKVPFHTAISTTEKNPLLTITKAKK